MTRKGPYRGFHIGVARGREQNASRRISALSSGMSFGPCGGDHVSVTNTTG